MFFATVLLAAAASVSALAVQSRDTCTYQCPSTDTEGNAQYSQAYDGNTLICLYGNSGAPLYEDATACNYDATTGAYTVGYGGCPAAILVWGCPAEDLAGNARYSQAVDGNTLVCLYGNSGAPLYEDATACNYDATTGAYTVGYGACPAASC
ncbi:hypothetical protein CALCODRAFT_512915 [Calocera cornea HHB12733]|uniref:Uncharacterized protein n=1 Tax=Calocera cornea HHB12733 TaxID=1353952 RepID=A0A165CNC6_9BASI|nr:hypothetical protein CALCODRAFT_512915 [Calocera cornea HHB12733]